MAMNMLYWLTFSEALLAYLLFQTSGGSTYPNMSTVSLQFRVEAKIKDCSAGQCRLEPSLN